MSSSLNKLLSIAGPSLVDRPPALTERLRGLAGPLTDGLIQMLNQRNGFYAFESALHVFPTISNDNEFSLDEWNADERWRAEYQDMAEGCLFFAEDIFGGQFCIKDGKVHTFDPETGALTYLTKSIEEWAAAIVRDWEVLTGYPLARRWQEQNGLIPAKSRLLPKVPFVLGGEYQVGNLYSINAVKGMRYRANLAQQLRDLPDGSQITFDVVD